MIIVSLGFKRVCYVASFSEGFCLSLRTSTPSHKQETALKPAKKSVSRIYASSKFPLSFAGRCWEDDRRAQSEADRVAEG